MDNVILLDHAYNELEVARLKLKIKELEYSLMQIGATLDAGDPGPGEVVGIKNIVREAISNG
jgi:hypothetical protein